MYQHDLIVRIMSADARIFEFIPVKALKGDFVRAFSHDFIHFLDVHDSYLEWRPLQSP